MNYSCLVLVTHCGRRVFNIIRARLDLLHDINIYSLLFVELVVTCAVVAVLVVELNIILIACSTYMYWNFCNYIVTMATLLSSVCTVIDIDNSMLISTPNICSIYIYVTGKSHDHHNQPITGTMIMVIHPTKACTCTHTHTQSQSNVSML